MRFQEKKNHEFSSTDKKNLFVHAKSNSWYIYKN